MIELKVQCDCGQKIKFDVEPLNGQMPFNFNCPVCGADGTAKANAQLQQMPQFAPAVLPPPPPISAAPAVGQSKLRLSASAHAPIAAPPVSSGESTPTPPPIAPFPRAAPIHVATIPTKKPNFGMGLLGGLLGALVGSLIYFLIFKYTGVRLKLLAVGVGALAGWGAELLGKGEGSKELGGITAILVLVGIVGAQYFVALGWWHMATANGIGDSAYAISVRDAKHTMIQIPTGSDGEIRDYLTKQSAENGDEANPNSVSDDEVKQFREKSLPELQDLAAGKITEAQYDTKNGIDPAQEKADREKDESTFKGIFLLLLLSRVNLFSLAAAAGLAFKLSTNA
jgi:hypothetical protein